MSDIPQPRRGRYMTPRTASFFDKISRELIVGHMGQSILLYQYSPDLSGDENDIYREKKFKKYEAPVLIPCSVNKDPSIMNDNDGYGAEGSEMLQVYIQLTELKYLSDKHERQIYPNMGDIVIFFQRIFEISNVDDSRLYSGSAEYPFSLSIECQKIRRSKINIDLPKDFY